MSDALIGGLLNLGGGLMSDMFGMASAKKNRRLTERQMQIQQGQFAQQMDQSIQRRVADAKKAGVHPLFALGASVGASPTATIGGGQPVRGSALGKAVSGLGQDLARAELAKSSSTARRDEAEAAYYDARTKALEQSLVARGRDGMSPGDPVVAEATGGVVTGPAQYVKPQVPVSQRTGVEAGTHPGSIEYKDKRGYTWTIPAPGLNMDEIGQVKYVLNAMASHGLGWRDVIGDAWWSYSNKVKAVLRNVERRKAIRRKTKPYNPDTDWISP